MQQLSILLRNRNLINLHLFIFLILLFGASKLSHAESSWKYVKLDNDIVLRDVYFKNPSIGLGFGGQGIDSLNGRILATLDSGATWNNVTPFQIPFIWAASFVDSITGYIGGEHGTILNTRDGGDSWERGIYDTAFTFIHLSAINKNICYAVVREQRPGFYPDWLEYRITKTIDGGATWIDLNSFDLNWITGIGVIDENNIIVVTHEGKIYRTGDGFATLDTVFTVQSYTEHDHYVNSIFFYDNQTGMCGVSDGRLILTEDSGRTWHTEYIVSEQSDTLDEVHSICFLDADTGWITNNSKIVCKTINGGATWEFDTLTDFPNSIIQVSCADGRSGVLLTNTDKLFYLENQVYLSYYSRVGVLPKLTDLIKFQNPYSSNTNIVSPGIVSAFHVYTLQGERLYTYQNNEFCSQTLCLKWDGTNNAGGVSSSGKYCFAFEFKEGNETKVLRKMVSYIQ